MEIFDLEQDIMECWRVCDDVDMVTKHFVDSPEWESMDGKLCDALMNKYFGIKELYELKFQRLWDTFENVSREYHRARKQIENTYSFDIADGALDTTTIDIGDIDKVTVTAGTRALKADYSLELAQDLVDLSTVEINLESESTDA